MKELTDLVCHSNMWPCFRQAVQSFANGITPICASFLAASMAQSQPASPHNSSTLTYRFGPDSTVTVYGYLKADFVFDHGFYLGDTTYDLISIGLLGGPAKGDFKSFTLQETNLGLAFEIRDLSGKLEYNFYGTDGRPDLQLAYVQWSHALIGQNWSNFVPVFAMAPTVDFQGPPGIPYALVPQVRYTHRIGKHVSLIGAIEQDATNKNFPALTIATTYENGDVTLKAAGILRKFSETTGSQKGWGVNLAGAWSPWRDGQILANATWGNGITDLYAASLTGPSLWLNGSVVGSSAYSLSVAHQVTKKLQLALTASSLNVNRAVNTDTKRLQTLHLSAFYSLNSGSTVMLEYFIGSRLQGDRSEFSTDRLQFAYKFTF